MEQTRKEILEATLRALSSHGYADITMRDIGEELNKDRSLIHYYFQNRRGLIADTLDYLLEYFVESLPRKENETAWRNLERCIQHYAYGPSEGNLPISNNEAYQILYEIRGLSAREPEHQTLLIEQYERIVSEFSEIIAVGRDQSEFIDIDPIQIGKMIVDLIDAARERQVVFDDQQALSDAKDSINQILLPAISS